MGSSIINKLEPLNLNMNIRFLKGKRIKLNKSSCHKKYKINIYLSLSNLK